jgi:hypothetical protein
MGKVFFGVIIDKIVWLGVPYSLAVGCGIVTCLRGEARIRPVRQGAGLLIVLVLAVLQFQGERNLYASTNPAWDSAAALTHSLMQPGDVIMDAPDEAAHSYNYYCRLLGIDLPHVYPAESEQTHLPQWADQYRRIWVPVPLPPQDNMLPDLPPQAERADMIVERFPFRSLTLYLVSAQPRKGQTR